MFFLNCKPPTGVFGAFCVPKRYHQKAPPASPNGKFVGALSYHDFIIP